MSSKTSSRSFSMSGANELSSSSEIVASNLWSSSLGLLVNETFLNIPYRFSCAFRKTKGRTTHSHPSPPSFLGLPGLFGRIARSSSASRRSRNQLLVPMLCARWCGKPSTTTQTTRIMGPAYTGRQHFAGYSVVCPSVLCPSVLNRPIETFKVHFNHEHSFVDVITNYQKTSDGPSY